MASRMHCAPKRSAPSAEQLGGAHGGRIDADLVGPGQEQAAHILDRANAAAHRQRQEDLIGHAAHHFGHGGASLRGGGDIQEGQFIRAGGVVESGLFHRVAGVAQVDKVHAFDDAPVGDIQAGNDAFG